MPVLTVTDHQVLADIAILGKGLVMLTRSSSHEEEGSTPSGHPISAWRVYRLIAAGKLVACEDGLFEGHAQTYRVA